MANSGGPDRLGRKLLLSPGRKHRGRLPGIDGMGKMSKSRGNALLLSASPDEISEAVRRMYTDPNHLRASDPGTVEGNVVFAYLDAFDPDKDAVEDLKARYRRGSFGDMAVKRRLEDVLQSLLAPIRSRRQQLARDPAYIHKILHTGTEKAKEILDRTLKEVRGALGIFSFETQF
jgi:tryptophanyl-tRNA synthetase